MGRDLGRAALMRCRTRPSGALLVGALLTVALLGLGAGPASAEDPTPTPIPSVSPPSEQQINDARAALERLRNQGKSAPPQLTQVAGAKADDDGGVTSRISDEAWWTMGAGLLVLMVASETTRVSARRAKHRKEA
jgi:hypothetical protein